MPHQVPHLDYTGKGTWALSGHRAGPGRAFSPLWSRIGALCPCCPHQQGQAGRLSVLGPTPSLARCLISSHSPAADPELYKHKARRREEVTQASGGGEVSLSWEASGPGLPWAQLQVTRTLAPTPALSGGNFLLHKLGEAPWPASLGGGRKHRTDTGLPFIWSFLLRALLGDLYLQNQ